MELKHDAKTQATAAAKSLNRTFMELKHVSMRGNSY